MQDASKYSSAGGAIPPASQLPGLRTALDIQAALTHPAAYIPVIGTCPTRENNIAVKIGHGTCADEWPARSDEKARQMTQAEKQLVTKLKAVLKNSATSSGGKYKAQRLDAPFRLTISLDDYTFDDILELNMDNGTYANDMDVDHSDDSESDGTEDDNIDVDEGADGTEGESEAEVYRVEEWFKHSRVSGFGDVREQVNKVDEDVRRAREIPASNFEVEPELLQRIAGLWGEYFCPSNVRVEPYKIHLYGKGGHFKPHRDTPQKDLVGTFLLGLGDSTDGKHLVVDGKYASSAEIGNWCAFYPDVPHEVKKIGSGYRAVVAFKIFRVNDGQEEAGSPSADQAVNNIPPVLRSAIDNTIGKLVAPFGIILDRKYCLGTTFLSGIDAAFLCSANARDDVTTEVIPIVMEVDKLDNYEDPAQVLTSVKPFTAEIIDFALERLNRKDPNVARWDSVKKVLFFDFQSEDPLVEWSSSETEIHHTGNESDGTREDSIYLSYAILCLQK